MEESTTQASLLNPYVVGGALSEPSGRGFYGRQDVFDFVRSGLAVEQRGPILLFGQRRIGKSSILRQLPNHLPDDLVCVYFDLQGKASMELDQVLYGLARAIAERLKLAKPTREEATEETFKEQFFARALHALNDEPRRLVLLFDEFDVVDEKLVGAEVAAQRFIGYLSDLTSAQPQFGCILVVGRRTEELSAGFNAALLKNSIQHKIGRLAEVDCSRLIQELAEGHLQFEADALQAIYAVTEGHPFCTQVLCNSIWSRHVREPADFPITITAASVMETIPLAIERGTTGLNWSFDGIIDPTQRLVLSAIAGELDSPTAPPVSLTTIERVLRSRQIGVDRAALVRAPQELERWDIIIKSDAGFRFAVPLIGLWIRKERPLDQLMSEVRFSNPQAYQYYELAAQAHKKGDLDRAILDYRGAVDANPVFLEAYRGLAAALVESKGVAGLDEAIEINERILEINPEESRTALLDLLSRALDEPSAVEKHLSRFARIRQLDADGYMSSRARRQLNAIGFSLMESYGYEEAEKVFLKLGEEESRVGSDAGTADRMVQKARSQRRFSFVILSGWAVATIVPFVGFLLALILKPQQTLAIRAIVWSMMAVGGLSLSVVVNMFRVRGKATLVGAGKSVRESRDSESGSGKWYKVNYIPEPLAVGLSIAMAVILFFWHPSFSGWQLVLFFLPVYLAQVIKSVREADSPAKPKVVSSDDSSSSSQASDSGNNDADRTTTA